LRLVVPSRRVLRFRPVLNAVIGLVLALFTARLAAQGQPDQGPLLAAAVATATAGEPAVLRYNNRPIVTLRATILSRTPAERAAGAVNILDGLVQRGSPGLVATRRLETVTIISVGNRDVFAILPLDVDELAGETHEGKASDTAAHLQQAIHEAVELRTPRRMLESTAVAAAATVFFAGLLWLTMRIYRVLAVRLPSSAERHLQRLSSGDAQILRASHAPDLLRHAVAAISIAVGLFFAYSWLTFVLRRFPYTRPWGESLRSFLFDRLGSLGLQMVGAIPDLFTVLVIVLITRFATRLTQVVFRAAEEGRVSIPYVYPETAQPTRRLVATLLWLLAIVVAYPYLPGSGSDAFKGLSVFVGLVLSLGSSGIVNQMMSGLTITYSRAVRVDDFVRIGEVEGTITHLGALSTKVKTPRGEEVTIPNAVVMSHVTTNYSRLAETEGVYIPTAITIGYDVPWRQVHALLLLAAERTTGLREQPKPVVRQTALQDFYVQYTLLVCIEQPHLRAPILDALHANIQDAFNEYGVQIMSPNYEADPHGPKTVPRDQWYAAPARPPVEGVTMPAARR
jgi:small-conductance mechanosensitive channel